MSKVIHLSDNAHNAAKNFCRQHGLKMSDWVADLVADAIVNNRIDPRTPTRSAPTAASPTPAPPQQPATPKKRLEQIPERPSNGGEDPSPWTAPPFWVNTQK